VIVAAGSGERMGGIEKMFVALRGEPLLLHSVRTFAACDLVDEVVLVTRRDILARVRALVERRGVPKVTRIIPGGATRGESSRHGLAALGQDIDLVLVHDGARPLVSDAVIRRVVEAAAADGAAIPGVPPVATIKEERGGACGATLDRSRLREAQTPQGFRRELLAHAMASALRDGFEGTDEAAFIERLGEKVRLVEGERRNLKVTVPDDLAIAAALLEGTAPPRATRIGCGYDIHRLIEGRPLVLGGVTLEHPLGLDGHSDADVLAHAICDALLGAAAAGDLGRHFPDDDERWRGVSGAELLARTVEILGEVGYVPANVDATVAAQAPRLAPHRDEMVRNLASALQLPEDRLSVKFTTTERLGPEGREEAISVSAVALIRELPRFTEAE
jgi:2-C-methyl-D-erythritol 4-phosphate cytidylyltransferase/2-C-methyl-D-erythritol 2,4-cyclodiphosphate synthase